RTVLTSHIETKDLLDLPIYRASKEAQTSFCDFVTQCAKSKFEAQQALKAITDAQRALMKKLFE
ncbi:MAG: hypothetical protein IJK97_01590, partial [Thermoguttaceae bacterium]|nr:hypothetical protein [Thermoguttaceae bacterium]